VEISAAEIKNRLTEKELKVTPQRMAILEAIYKLNNHPTAEKIIELRNKRNGFKKIEELLDAKGIGQKKFSAIANYLYIEK